MVKNIREHIDPKEFNNNVHFNKSLKGELLIRFEALKATVPEKTKESISINGLWNTSSGYSKALASVPHGVLATVRRIRVGLFCAGYKTIPHPHQGVLSVMALLLLFKYVYYYYYYVLYQILLLL